MKKPEVEILWHCPFKEKKNAGSNWLRDTLETTYWVSFTERKKTLAPVDKEIETAGSH